MLNSLFKVAILILAASFIYIKLNNNTNLYNFNTLVQKLSAKQLGCSLIFVFTFMLLNWFLEALKWKFLVKRVERISLWRAIESVFCGLTLAVFTPNRIGEYGGRVFFLSPKRRILGIVAMSIGALGQMVVTNILGALATLWFVNKFLSFNSLAFAAFIVFTIFFCLFFFILFFNIKWLIYILTSIPWLKRFGKFFVILSRYHTKDLFKIFVLCLGRFCVFTSQYAILINMLIPHIVLFDMVMMVCILFFVQSALPSLDLLDVGVRTLTASYFFSYITQHDVAIIATAAFMWLVNLIIPAILGSVFVFKLNFFGTNRT